MMKYYKIIHKPTGEVSCYVKNSSSTDIVSEICGLFGDEYGFEEIRKEEYERESEDAGDDESEDDI